MTLVLGLKIRPSRSIVEYLTPRNAILHLAATLIAPIHSLLSGEYYVKTLIWSIAPAVILIDWALIHAVRQGQASIDELERMKYDAKGA